jgi:16S rRNA processing protein RimM
VHTSTSSTEIEIGWVWKAHGLRGELSVRLHWPESTALATVSQLRLSKDSERRVFRVDGARPGNGAQLVRLAGIDDRTEAERWRGAKVLVERAQLPDLADNEYYLADLVGARVLAPDGEVGRVVELIFYPSVDCMVIESATGQRMEQPLLPEWVAEVSASAREVKLTSRDGLITQD